MSAQRSPRRPKSVSVSLPTGTVRTDTADVTLVPDPGAGHRVTLYIDGIPSSHIDLADPTHLEFKYMQWMAGMINAWFATADPVRAMHIGGAGCTMARYLAATRPQSHQLALEVDAKLAELVRAWFDLPRSPQLRIRVQDGRIALENSAPVRWEIIIRDAFAGAEVPKSLTSTAAAEHVYRALAPEGIYLANCADYPPLLLARQEVATLAQFFGPNILICAEPGIFSGRRHGNVIILAAKDGERLREVTAKIARNVRSSSIPARMLAGQELKVFAAGATPLTDE